MEKIVARKRYRGLFFSCTHEKDTSMLLVRLRLEVIAERLLRKPELLDVRDYGGNIRRNELTAFKELPRRF